MDVTIDVETYKRNEETGKYEPYLDATGEYFTLGCIYKENGSFKIYTSKEQMWKELILLGIKEFYRGKRLRVFGHNAKYDFFNFMDKNDKNIRWFSQDPFIASYYITIRKEFRDNEEKNKWTKYAKRNKIFYYDKSTHFEVRKEIIKFGDTISLYRMSLEKVGKVINIPKLKIPIEIGEEITENDINEIGKYCANDCRVSMEAIKYLKIKLAEDGIVLRNLCTINQIAISYIINKLRKEKKSEGILQKNGDGKLSERVYQTKNPEEIHMSYRASPTRVWKTGIIENITDIDCNSLYPYSIVNMRCPDLSTERKVENPLEMYKLKDLLGKIGISKVLIYNKNNELGLIPIRTKTNTYFPKKGKYMIGIYTHEELEKSLKEGYEILKIEWSIIWDEGENPFRKIYNELYERRKEEKSEFDNFFYKAIMNSSIGKFAQHKINQEIFIDEIELAKEYKKRNIEIIRGIEGSTQVMYKTEGDKTVKSYYAPIISSYVTSYARIHMYNKFKEIGIEDLIYSDTDSIIFRGEHLNKFRISEKMGDFKIEKDKITNEELKNVQGLIWGSKAKMIGNNITAVGVFKSELTKELFTEGKAKVKKMIGIKNIGIAEVGKFIIENKDFKEQERKWKETQEIYDEIKIYVDEGLKDISYFTKDIEEIAKREG